MASPTQILVADQSSKACFKVVGRGDFRCSDDLRLAIRRLREGGCAEFTFDLGECSHMDSTFIGVLASPLRQRASAESAACTVRISRADNALRQIFEDMGLGPLLEFVDDATVEAGFEPASTHSATRVELSETSLEAHETLMALDPERNRSRFQDVVTYLRKELRRTEDGKSQGTGQGD